MRKSIIGLRTAGLLLVALALVLVACCGSQATPEPVTYTVNMTEFAFQPAELHARVGQQVTIELTNSGALEHEFMAGRDIRMTNNRPDGYQHDMFANQKPQVMSGKEGGMGSHGMGHDEFMAFVPAGAGKVTLIFTPTKDMVGEWEIGCFAQEGVHYDAGMKGKFVVTE